MTYSVTLNIEEDLVKCQSVLSTGPWDSTPNPDTPTDVLCGIFVAKMRFHTSRRLLRLPFLLKAYENEKYQSGRLAVLQISREMINVYSVWGKRRDPCLRFVEWSVFRSSPQPRHLWLIFCPFRNRQTMLVCIAKNKIDS